MLLFLSNYSWLQLVRELYKVQCGGGPAAIDLITGMHIFFSKF